MTRVIAPRRPSVIPRMPALAALLAFAPAAAAHAAESPVPTETSRRQGEAGRMEDSEKVLDLGLAYTADIWHNSGGAKPGWRYLDNLDVIVGADLDAAVGWHGARLFAYGLYNNGHSLSDLTGDAQAASNIETGVEAFRLYEAWIEQDFGAGASVKLGLYDLNSEFDALYASALFISSAHGIGTDISQSGRNGPSIFPVTSLALRVEAKVSDEVTARFAVLDGVPGDPDHPRRTAIKLGHGDGAFAIGEADWRHGKLRLIGGAWGYTRELERHGLSGTAPSHGAYLRGEMELLSGDRGKVSVFGRLGMASGAVNMFSGFASAGVTLDLTDDWQFGAAIAHARTSHDYRRATSAGPAETSIELTAAKAITPWLSLQPDVQYVIDPSAAPGVDDALVAGLRVTVSL
ncbi:carbohydrate porin [Novosphingobium sp. BL-8A]|uniref:carbohydrate porin n=1 Tax=Novosphingobium sp. BL-8A TaxID=3127639 RepID=UPI0037583BAC